MKTKMTPAQFAAASTLARLSADRSAVARAVLVEGKTYSGAVEPFGWTRQAAYGPVKSIQEHWSRYLAARDAEASAQSAASQSEEQPAEK